MSEPTKTEVTSHELNRFVQTVDAFMAKYATLSSPATAAIVANSGDVYLQADYKNAMQQGALLKATIEKTVGAWNAAKKAYAQVTDVTSTVIGDAIDAIRGIFGYKPTGDFAGYIRQAGLGAFGAVQLPAAAWIAGIVSAAYLLNSVFDKISVRINAAAIKRDNPGMPLSEALKLANQAKSGLFGFVPLLLGAAAAVYFFTRKN